MKQKTIAKIGMKNRSIPSMSVVKNHNIDHYINMALADYLIRVKRMKK